MHTLILQAPWNALNLKVSNYTKREDNNFNEIVGYNTKGMSGRPTRALIEYARRLAEKK